MLKGTLHDDPQRQIEQRPCGNLQILFSDPAPFAAGGEAIHALRLQEHGRRGRQDVEQEEEQRGERIAQDAHGGGAHKLHAEGGM